MLENSVNFYFFLVLCEATANNILGSVWMSVIFSMNRNLIIRNQITSNSTRSNSIPMFGLFQQYSSGINYFGSSPEPNISFMYGLDKKFRIHTIVYC